MKPGSMGRPLPGYRITLLDHDDNPAKEGELALILDPTAAGFDGRLRGRSVEDAGRDARRPLSDGRCSDPSTKTATSPT